MKPVSIRHNVSEAVRQALLVLAQERLVSHSRNCGFSVVNLTGEDRKEGRQIRLPLETLSLERLSGLKDRMVQAGISSQFDLEFHGLICHKSGNAGLMGSLRNLPVPYFAYGSAFKVSIPDLTPQLLEARHKCYEECVRFL